MSESRVLTRQELCVQLRISESTVRRLELDGLPCTPVGRSKRYDLAECKQWLRSNQGHKCQSGSTSRAVGTSESWSQAAEYIASSQQVRRRVTPSSLKLISDAT